MNKGDKHSPSVRGRLVAQEVNTYREDAFVAATPPLEALRLLLSHAATNRDDSEGGRKFMVLDAKKAHLHAFAEREVYIELPPERWKPGVCGRLSRSLYGMRDAPALWDHSLAAQLEAVGFIRAKANPCLFRHELRDILAVVHGDDLMFNCHRRGFEMGTQGARTSDLAEGGRHHWRRQLGFAGTQGLEPRVEVAGVGNRLRG